MRFLCRYSTEIYSDQKLLLKIKVGEWKMFLWIESIQKSWAIVDFVEEYLGLFKLNFL